ncbi:hypothetical protein [Flavihumibacter sp. UBA7668]|uniref:hypothetical protein n=1 Tax=Flavihumibacter sp. UBA7668 TaxID=1946542 RepID=UPI0025C5A820|nr:hypothetical protein [Flavihumibacter sp. UBA7668]
MKTEILANINQPEQLEKMYRNNKSGFRKAFGELDLNQMDRNLASFWNARLSFNKEEGDWVNSKDLIRILLLAVLAGLLARIPDIFSIEEEFYYSRNLGFILFPALILFFGWKRQLSIRSIAGLSISIITSLVFINWLPGNSSTDTVVLSSIHMILFLWSLLGFTFIGGKMGPAENRLEFLRYNGDLVVMTTLILIAGGILTGVTIGLFSLIGFNIEEFYFKHIVVSCLPAAPILATWLIQTNPQLVGRVSPVIARLFSPLVLVMLIIYLGAILYSGKDPYNDREFLLMFNGLLIGVMAILFFSVAENSRSKKSVIETWMLFLLAAITVIVNGIALSAILFRIAEWGITPNRAAVLGGNMLILLNLVIVTIQLFGVVRKKADFTSVSNAIALYLPVYFIWTIIVTFLFPIFF